MLACGHPRPQMAQRIGSAAPLEPLQVRGADEIRHRETEEAAIGVELRVRRQLSAHRPLAKDGRADRAARPSRSGDATFDDSGVAFEHPPWRGECDRIQRQNMGEELLDRVARRPQQMDEVRRLVHGQQIDPVAEFADLALRPGRLGEENDAR